MDFIGLRSCEQERLVDDGCLLFDTEALVYDNHFRRSMEDQYQAAVTMGLVMDSNSFEQNGILNICQDEYECMAKICNDYLLSEPRYIPMTNDSFCDQRRESFRHWLASKTSQLRFRSLLPFYKVRNVHLVPRVEQLPKEHQNDLCMTQLFKNFVNLPRGIVFEPRLAICFSLPVISEKANIEIVMEDWLTAMSWWKVVNKELHPVLCKLRHMSETKFSGDSCRTVGPEELRERLRKILRNCDKLKNILDLRDDSNIETKYEHLVDEGYKSKSLKGQDKMFIEHLFVYTVTVAHNVIIYLVHMKLNDRDEENFDWLIKATRRSFQSFEENVKKMFSQKHWFSIDSPEERLVGFMLEQISKTIKLYSNRIFFISSEVGDEDELQQQTLTHVQKFLCAIMDTIMLSCTHSLYKFFRIKLKKDEVRDIVRELNLHVTWTSMNILTGRHHFRSQNVVEPKPAPKPFQVREALRLMSSDAVHKVLPIVNESMKDCEAHLFITRPKGTTSPTIPVYVIYEDFSNYQKALTRFFSICSHPLIDLAGHTHGRLTKFMTETLVCFHMCRRSIEIALLQAEQYMSHNSIKHKP